MQQKQTQKARAITPELRRRLLILGAKIIGIILVIYILLFRIYGLTRIDTNVMAPSVEGGDLALIFRPVGELSVGDVVSYRCGDRACTGRIAAKASTTGSRSMLFCKARSICTTAPNRRFTLR